MRMRLSARRVARNAALAVLALAALADARATDDLRAGDARLATIAWRLQTGGRPLCTRIAPISGLTIESAAQYPSAVRKQFDMDARPMIAAVGAGSPAARAGLAVGDVLVRIDDQPTPEANGNRIDPGPVLKTELMLAAALARPPAEIVYLRGGIVHRVDLATDSGCAARLQLVAGGFQATRADGRTVQLSDRMLAFAQTDDELAAVVAHELAHVILEHAARGTASREAEYAADWMSVWLVARAGYDLDAIVPFWTRLGQRTDAGLFSDGTHPGWRKRTARLAEAVALVKTQRAAGQPLMPPPEQQSASQSGKAR